MKPKPKPKAKAKAKLVNKPVYQYAFKAALDAFRIDREGEAKLTLAIPKTEAKGMAELSQFDNRLFQVAVIVLPESEMPDEDVE